MSAMVRIVAVDMEWRSIGILFCVIVVSWCQLGRGDVVFRVAWLGMSRATEMASFQEWDLQPSTDLFGQRAKEPFTHSHTSPIASFTLTPIHALMPHGFLHLRSVDFILSSEDKKHVFCFRF